MAKKLFVGGIPYGLSSSQLEELFSKYGKVLSANVIIDRMTNRSKGFGFVEMEDDDEADKAMNALNGSDVDGRKIAVNEAKPREERPSYNRN